MVVFGGSEQMPVGLGDYCCKFASEPGALLVGQALAGLLGGGLLEACIAEPSVATHTPFVRVLGKRLRPLAPRQPTIVPLSQRPLVLLSPRP